MVTPDDAEEPLLQERRPWLRAEAVTRENGGYDIVLVIDGTYLDGAPSEMVDYWNCRLRKELGDQSQGECG